MSADRWQLLADWHNEWLEADEQARTRLRADLASQHPELVVDADVLIAASPGLPGFMETSALTLVARDLVADDDPLLAPDTVVGPYRITGVLARGGMGDVYRATDVRLHRDVALKLLARGGTGDAQRIARFLQEARITAALDHPNIVKVFDIGVLGGRPYLVAELLEGETLRSRLERGPLPAEEAIRIAVDVTAGLVAAHGAGLVHRDLKPDNVFLTRSGVTKTLDFGIAKLADAPAVPGGLSTLTGVLLGTAGYLSPEQIAGAVVDGRTDLFALGSMLFEMVTGRRAFAREHTIDTLHAILHEDPPAEALLTVRPELRAIVIRLLQKSAAARFQSAADLGWSLARLAPRSGDRLADEVAAPPGTAREPPRRSRQIISSAALIALIALIAVAGVGWFRRATVRNSPTIRFSIPPPPGYRFGNSVERTQLAFSPDGSQLAFIAAAPNGPGLIWVRALSELDARPLAGTDGATSVFWSPDGRSLAFFAGDKLKRLDLPNGAAVPLCDVPSGVGLAGTWGSRGDILFAGVEGEAIVHVTTQGGTPVAFVTPNRARGESRVSWPWFLPDGRRFLYLLRRGDGTGQVMLGEGGRPSVPIVTAASNPQWVEPGYVVFARDGILVGQRVDLEEARVMGEAFPIAETIDYSYSTGRAEFATSRNGHVVYQAHLDQARLIWTDRRGNQLGQLGTPGRFQTARISPDVRRVLYDRFDSSRGAPDLWMLDLERGGDTRLTTDNTSEAMGVWIRKGAGVLFMADRGGPPHLYRKDLTTGAEETVLPPGRLQQPTSVSPDGTTLAYAQRTSSGTYDILTLPIDGPGATPTVLLGTPFDEVQLRFSPDGRAAAYLSNESGRYELYVATYPGMSSRQRVSDGGARAPEWDPVRNELLYFAGDGRLIAVPVRTTPEPRLGRAETLFTVNEEQSWIDFDVSPDGQRLLAIALDRHGGDQPLTMILNWPVPTARN